MWPFGFGNKYPYTNFHELNADWILDKIRGLEASMQHFITDTKDTIVNTVNTWLDDHPEATTTVEDGMITYPKLSSTLIGNGIPYTKPYINTDSTNIEWEHEFVTPQMFGGKGDGVTDDTAAIQDALDSGKTVFFPRGTYLITDTIEIINWIDRVVYAGDAIIHHTGAGFAFYFRSVVNCTFEFGTIRSDNGGCMLFECRDASEFSQYINIFFHELSANSASNCVQMTHVGGWINEVRWYNGRVSSGKVGFYIQRNQASGGTNGWHWHEVGFEGVETGIVFQCDSGTIGYCEIENCRYQESITYLMKSRGNVRNIFINGCSRLNPAMIDCDSNLTECYINGSVVEDVTGIFLSNEARIWRGNFIVKPLNGTAIDPNTNLDTCIAPYGFYFCESGTDPSTLTNCPTTEHFVMHIYPVTAVHMSSITRRAWERWMRVIITQTTGTIYVQTLHYDNDPTVPILGEWRAIITT